MKQCFTCKEYKHLADFHKSNKSKDGRKGSCKKCRNKENKIYNKTPRAKELARKRVEKFRQTEKGRKFIYEYNHSESKRRNMKKYHSTEKGKATRKKSCIVNRTKFAYKYPSRDAVKYAVRMGWLPNIKTLNCYKCGHQAQVYHHFSYEKKLYLMVVPVCYICHKVVHLKKSS